MQNEAQRKEQEAAWIEYDRFKKDYELSLKTNKTLPEIVKSIMEEKGLTIDDLVDKSKIDKRTIYRLRSGIIKTRTRDMEYLPSIKTIVAFCIACRLDMLNAITLLETVGLSFKRTSEVHYAYCYLIMNCRGKTIGDCNKVLRDFGIDEEDLLREGAEKYDDE